MYQRLRSDEILLPTLNGERGIAKWGDLKRAVVEGVVLAPLRYREPDRLAMVWENNPQFPRVWNSYRTANHRRLLRPVKRVT